MKFEHVLKIYWTKGLLFNNTLEPFSTPLKALFKNTNIVGESTTNLLVERFEVRGFLTDRQFIVFKYLSCHLLQCYYQEY